MLFNDATKPTLVCLHFLGGSGREWKLLSERLGPAVDCVALDLPGFGDLAGEPGMSISEMADRIVETLRGKLQGPWLLVGHSMGAKLALVLAHRAETGDVALEGLAGIVVVAGSPPSPEPMSNAKRAEMVAWIDADPSTRRRKAEDFIADNVGDRLEPDLELDAVEDVLRANPAAWKTWLTDGSREDWCRTIGVLQTPALILSGTADADLGPAAQDALMAPHFARYEHITFEGAGHLLPLERPNAVADRIAAFMIGVPPIPETVVPVDREYHELIASSRVSSRLRVALNERAEIDDPAYRPKCLDPVELSILRATCGRVLPQPGMAAIDIAARIDRRLAEGSSDGWRFAALPVDRHAYSLALRTLDAVARTAFGRPFVTLDQPTQDVLLASINDDSIKCNEDGFDREKMKLWFEDLRADVVRVYLAHPAALARLGFSGIGAGGDNSERLAGFRDIGIGEQESWEPIAAGDR